MKLFLRLVNGPVQLATAMVFRKNIQYTRTSGFVIRSHIDGANNVLGDATRLVTTIF
jgi:hypothetical protein